MPASRLSSPADPVDRAGATAKAGAVADPRDLLHRGLTNARAGEIKAALRYLDAAFDRAEELDDADRVALLTTTIDCRLARGELGEARVVGQRLAPYLEGRGRPAATAHAGMGELRAASDELEAAAAHFARLPDLLGPDDDDPDALPWRTAAALTAVRLGQRAAGTALAREHLTLAGVAGAPYAIALGLRTLATVDAHTDRESLLRQALDELDGIVAARLLAQVRTDLAGLLLLGQDPDDAAEALGLLRDAEQYAGRQSLGPLLGRVRRLLDRMGEGPDPIPGETLASLTAAEQRVARLAATGLTNREVAAQLVVTVKAVEWHLSHVYRKLGIHSRTALAGALGPDH